MAAVILWGKNADTQVVSQLLRRVIAVMQWLCLCYAESPLGALIWPKGSKLALKKALGSELAPKKPLGFEIRVGTLGRLFYLVPQLKNTR